MTDPLTLSFDVACSVQHAARVMSLTRVIRHVTRPECADENERLIGAVFADLDALKPEGLQYTSFRLEDGLTGQGPVPERRDHAATGRAGWPVTAGPCRSDAGPRVWICRA